MAMHRRARIIVLVLLLVIGTTACGERATLAPTLTGDSLVPIVAASELVIGQNRLPIGVLKNGATLNDPDLALTLRFFYLDGDNPDQMQFETQTIYRGAGLPIGLYVAYPEFDRAGAWSVETSIPRDDGTEQVQRLRLDVLEQSRTLSVGEAAIASQTPTVHDDGDLTRITSDSEPDPDFYQLSIAEAVAANRPFVVAFATPSFCQTAVCGPNMQVLKRLKTQFGERANFIHVEVYPYPFSESFEQQRYVPAMAEWRLRTEPWTFLADAEGVIQAKYEGGITFAEMEPALEQLAAGEPVTLAPR